VAPETAHCVKGAIDEALRCKKTGEEKVIFFANSGHGHFDLAAYDAYIAGKLTDYEYPAELVKEALAKVPKIGGK
jgi:tryptophan synthase beta chain